MFDLRRHIISSAHALLHLILLLFGRHWIVGLINIALTALLGLGVVRAAERWRFLRLPPQIGLQLRHIVLIAALFKGAFYLVLGESLNGLPNYLWITGVQLPGPIETLGLMAQTIYSIWHLTQISRWVFLILFSLAVFSLLYRLSQLLLARRAFTLWMRIGTAPSQERALLLLEDAARRMGLPKDARLPRILEVDLLYGDGLSQTPLLIGLGHPLLLLPSRLVKALSEAELEMVLRHELAHFIRRDHWWRWLLLWATDIAWWTLLALPLKQWIIEIEERLCDRLAVQSPQEASLLASALKAASATGKLQDGASLVPQSSLQVEYPPITVPFSPVVPLMLGSYATVRQPLRILRGRLEGLLIWSNELAAVGITKKTSWSERTGISLFWAITLNTVFQAIRAMFYCLLAFLLLLILYAKFYVALNLR